jgi:hypothetical protein
MTMQLVGPYMTTTRYNLKQKQSKSKKLQKAQAEHEQWLVKMGVGKSKAQHTNEIPNYKTSDTVPLGNNIAGHGPQKESMVYSGERQLLGIATMHKSNMVPVFADRKEDAKDISSMRR